MKPKFEIGEIAFELVTMESYLMPKIFEIYEIRFDKENVQYASQMGDWVFEINLYKTFNEAAAHSIFFVTERLHKLKHELHKIHGIAL